MKILFFACLFLFAVLARSEGETTTQSVDVSPTINFVGDSVGTLMGEPTITTADNTAVTDTSTAASTAAVDTATNTTVAASPAVQTVDVQPVIVGSTSDAAQPVNTVPVVGAAAVADTTVPVAAVGAAKAVNTVPVVGATAVDTTKAVDTAPVVVGATAVDTGNVNTAVVGTTAVKQPVVVGAAADTQKLVTVTSSAASLQSFLSFLF